MGLNLGVMSAAVTLDDHDYRRTLSGLEGASRSTFKNIASMAAQFLSLYSVYAGIKVATEKFYAQQDAIESVRASLRNLGAEYIGATARFQKFAAEIQKKTKFGDEYVLGAMSSGLRLGINPEDIENVTKSAIGLTAKLGVDLPTAMKLLARANAGHTEMLSRMGLQIDESLSKEEKFQHVLKAGADAFGLAEEAAKTAGGKLAQFKNNAGDAAEFVGKRLQDALAPSISLLNGLALSFNESDKATQGLVVNITAAAAAFALLAKSGALAQANTAFAGRASIVLANGWGAAKKAANGLAAAIGPVGAAMIALSAAYMAYQYLSEKNRKELEGQVTLSQEKASAAEKEAEANQKSRESDAAQLSRLEELSKYERLNNIEKKEAEQIIQHLTKTYGSLDVAIDKTTGKVLFGAKAWQQMNDAQAQALRKDLAKQINTSGAMIAAQQNALRDKLSSFWKNSVYGSISASVGNLFGSDDNTQGDFSYRAKNSERQQELDRILKLKTAEEQIAAFERMRISLTNEGEKEKADAVKEIIDGMKKQLELQKQLDASRKRKPGEKPTGATPQEKKVQSEAERKAQTALETKEWEIKFNAASVDEQVAMLDKKLNDVFSRQSGKYGSIDDFKNADRAAMSEQELKDLQEILDLEQKRLQLRKQSAEAFQQESETYQKYLQQREKQQQRKEIERQIKAEEDSGNRAGVDAIIQREYEKARDAAQMLQREYEMAVREAEADKILTADEKKRVAELRTKMQEAMSDEDRWRERGIDSADKKATGGARSAVGAWSAATLSAILGGDHKPEEETAKNTKELVRIMRAEAERKTLRW